MCIRDNSYKHNYNLSLGHIFESGEFSARAKKFIPRQQTFTSKAHNNLQGVFPTMIGFVTLGHLLFIGDHAKKGGQG